MFCTQCGATVAPGTRYCGGCGAPADAASASMETRAPGTGGAAVGLLDAAPPQTEAVPAMATLGWWCLNTDEKTYGPYSLNTMRALLSQGVLSPDSAVRHNTQDTWRPAGDVAELHAAPSAAVSMPVMQGKARKQDRITAAEAGVPCLVHANRMAITVCNRCHAPACVKCVYKLEHWMCKKCHASLYNRRTLAGLVDYVCIPLLAWGALYGAIGVGLSARGRSEGAGLTMAGLILSVYLLVALYFLFKDGIRQGRSPGKGLCSIRVVDLQSGAGCTNTQSIKRNSALAAGQIPVFGIAFRLWWIVDVSRAWHDPRGLRSFDRFAQTMVVDDPAALERVRRRVYEQIAWR